MRSGKLLEWCCFYDFNNNINVNQKLYIKMRTADRSPSKEFEQIVVAWKSPIVRKMNAFLIRKKNWEKFQLNCLGSLRSNDNRWCKTKTIFIKFMRSVWCVWVYVCISIWKKLHAEFWIDLCAHCAFVHTKNSNRMFHLSLFIFVLFVSPSKPLILLIIAFLYRNNNVNADLID